MIIAIDGPAASGKGTIARKLAKHFNLGYLDTGILYRAVALQMLQGGINIDDPKCAEKIAREFTVSFIDKKNIRTEAVSVLASKIAALPGVRHELLHYQKSFAKNPGPDKYGAILDGRDIGTIVCPNADFKIFITADLKIRAKRRWKQLLQSDQTVIYSDILEELRSRDERDRCREEAPLVPAAGSMLIDTSDMTIDVAFDVAKNAILSQNI